MTTPFFRFRASASSSGASNRLEIFDEIGFDGVQPTEFNRSLVAAQGPSLDVEINSPGGDLFAGIAIYNMLRHSGKTIRVKVMGIAASAASVVAMAGESIEMPKNTFFMVHRPMMNATGNADDLRERAGTLDKLTDSIISIYKTRTGQPATKLKQMLDAETWIGADEALSLGFATRVSDEIRVNNNAIASARARALLAARHSGGRPVVITTSSLWDAHRNQTKDHK